MVLASNTKYTGEKSPGFGAVDQALIHVGCVTIGAFGLVTKPWDEYNKPYDGPYMPGFESRYDYAERASELVEGLRRRGAKLVVMLSHLGLREDKKVAVAVNTRMAMLEMRGIDVILGGHSHSKLEEPVRIGDTFIVHGGSSGRFLSHLEILVDTNDGEITHSQYALVNNGPGSRAPDPEVQAVVTETVNTYAPDAFSRIGKVSRDLDRADIADILVRASHEQLGADAVLVRHDGSSMTWKAGDLTEQTIMQSFAISRMPSGTPGLSSLYTAEISAGSLFQLYQNFPDPWVFSGPACISPTQTYRIILQKAMALHPDTEGPLPLVMSAAAPVMEAWELVEEYVRNREARGLYVDRDRLITE